MNWVKTINDAIGYMEDHLTDEITPITENWKENGLRFDAIYPGLSFGTRRE